VRHAQLVTRKSRFTAFDVFNYLFFTIICAVCLIPIIHILAKSLSDANSVIRGDVTLWPLHVRFDSYVYIAGNASFLRALGISVLLSTGGTAISVILTAMTAYPLSKVTFRGRKLVLYVFVFTWLFTPSIVPLYFLMKTLGLLNNILSLILVDVIWCFNMLIVKSYFESVPESLSEAAQIEGASNARTLFQIIIPLSKPIIATIAVYSAFGYWNMYFYPIMFISKPALRPLQLYIYELIMNSRNFTGNATDDASRYVASVPDIVRSATVFVSIIPIMAVYPFVQKHFVKGLLLGSVKG
jgi:putative aldouronate transport system permease protein